MKHFFLALSALLPALAATPAALAQSPAPAAQSPATATGDAGGAASRRFDMVLSGGFGIGGFGMPFRLGLSGTYWVAPYFGVGGRAGGATSVQLFADETSFLTAEAEATLGIPSGFVRPYLTVGGGVAYGGASRSLNRPDRVDVAGSVTAGVAMHFGHFTVAPSVRADTVGFDFLAITGNVGLGFNL